jgi:lipopolysaccharide/colanic/teichoic acid biosynthesis glycosyltransferase
MMTDTLEMKVEALGNWTVETSSDTKPYFIVKRAIDVVGSIIAFAVLSPFFLFAALFIKIFSRGPVFFKQTRVGQHGKPFEIYKFRSMKMDAEKYSGPVWATKNDNRLIPGGNFLRKSKIDEIPQFINVLKGEMSIIGPRPERPFFVERLKDPSP